MEPRSLKIASLSEDIKQIADNMNGDKVEMIRFCKDHPEPLLLIDNKPVLNITQNEFIGIFNMNLNHYFLHPDQVLRVGMFFNLSFARIIALMLKAEWEIFFSEMLRFSSSSEHNLGLKLKNRDLVEKYISDFNPGNCQINNLISNSSYGTTDVERIGYIDFFISDLLEDNIFLQENKHIGKEYPDKIITEKMLLHDTASEQRTEYLKLKELWDFKSTELDDYLLQLESEKKLNLAFESKYYSTFRVHEVDKSILSYRIEKYKIVIKIMKDQPGLSFREVISTAVKEMSEVEKTRNEFKIKITRSFNCIGQIITIESNPLVGEEFRASYEIKCKQLLREIFKLLHPDKWSNYPGLSDYKKGQISKLWLKLSKSTKDELYSFSPNMLLYSLPDLGKLKSIYNRACKILGIQPKKNEPDNRLEFMISKGTPVEGLIQFLYSEIQKLELHLANLELIHDEYTHENEARYYKDAREDIRAHSERLKSEISDLKVQIEVLEKNIPKDLLKILNEE